MNGVHDMGGMHGLGPIQYEENEPVFHTRWEARTFALNLAMGAWGKWNIDAGRHQIELIPPAEYLRMSYYEKWYARLVALIANSGLVTRVELESGRPEPGTHKASPALPADRVPKILAGGAPVNRPIPETPRFRPGERVRARNIHPVNHTRLPRYVRGKLGTIERHHAAFVFPDTNARFLGENPQHVYSVRFAARELWGDQASSRDAVYVDMWDNYLEPA